MQRHFVAFALQVEAFVLAEFVDQPLDDALVDVVAAEVSVAIGGLNLDDAFADFQNRNVEGAAAEVIDGNHFVLAFVEAVGKGGSRRLVDDALDVEAGNFASVLGSLALRVVKVRRHSDDRLGDFFAEIVFRRLLQLLQNERGNFLRRVGLVLGHDGDVIALADDFIGHHLHFFVDFLEAASHEALDGENGAFRVGNGLPFGDQTNRALPCLGEADDGGRGAAAFFVGDNFGLATLHNRNYRIGGTEVDSDDFSHFMTP